MAPPNSGAVSNVGGAGASNVSGSAGTSGGSGSTVSQNGGTGGTNAGSAGASGATPSSDACPPSWTTSPGCGAGSNPAGPAPDFGPRVLIFDPSMSTADVQSKLSQANQQMDGDQFDDNGYAYLFKPGNYGTADDNLDVRVGFYTHVIGLGESPDDVTITGAVRSKAFLGGGNATCNFWRTAENFAVVPGSNIDGGIDVWAVSQGTAIRRAHVKGSIQLHDNGWASGGFVVDSKIDQTIDSGPQQQFFTRNSDLHNWTGGGWNMVFAGDTEAPKSSWPQPPRTVSDTTPVLREKPFLYVDASGNYLVMVPQLKMNSSGPSWTDNMPPGSPISIDNFYIAKPDTDSASSLNAALASGKHLLLTPGDYKLDSALQITKPTTVVLGIGFPTLTPTQGNTLISLADVDGISVAGILIEAAKTSSATLLQAGDMGSTADHSQNPSALFDVHCRIGGHIAGTASICFTINSNNVLIDNTWLWRADHGAGADWNTNKSDSGIVVNGNNVTIYGLFAEHFQKYQTLWNGNGGSVFFYQSELPYDPPNQAAWMEAPNQNGYASYKVADSVTTHQAQGLGVYSFFHSPVHAANAIETPTASGIVMHHMMTYGSGTGLIDNIINGTGGPAQAYSAD
ncbi:MAG TPA: coagulation factor 5/8 type domain-containing protein [Polyangiaceae bacterium]|nr:coagulation factor 5/8 type domain-containing protein [Polyangiaceae bacterium]